MQRYGCASKERQSSLDGKEVTLRGKCGFVLGLAVGYVLGTRAGRQRYEQIKKVAGNAWESAPVVKLRGEAKRFVGDKAQAAQDFVAAKGRQIVHAATAPKHDNSREATSDGTSGTAL